MLRIVWNSIKGKRKEVKRSIFVLAVLYACSLAVANSYESILGIKDEYSAIDFFFREYLEDIVCVAIIGCVIMGIWYLFQLRKETSFDGFHSLLVAMASNKEMFARYCISLIISVLLYTTSYIGMVLIPIYKLVQKK